VANQGIKRAIYPGTFDPITRGHVDLIERSLNVFDELVVLVARSQKKSPLFTDEERKQMVEGCFKGNPKVTVEIYDGLLVNYCKRTGIHTSIRGLRAVSDFEYEFQMATMNRRMGDLQTFFLMASEKFIFVNSTVVKEVAVHGGDVSELVPPHVEAALKAKFKLKKG